MKTSEQTNELAAALAKAASTFPKIERGRTATVYPKDSSKKPYSYDYADLDDVLSAVRLPLAENGLTISHDCRVTRDPLCLEVIARLDHASGQWKESEPLPMPCEGTMSAAQQIGSAYTYGRRYTSQAILGISTEADDDGHAAGDLDSELGRKEERPACPQCGTNKSVIIGKPEYGGGFVCYAKKGGCGHKWQPEPEQPFGAPREGEAKSKAKKVAQEHGMKTADELPPPSASHKKALDKISAAIRARDEMEIARIMNVCEDSFAKGLLTEGERTSITNECTLALKKIKALENEPVAV